MRIVLGSLTVLAVPPLLAPGVRRAVLLTSLAVGVAGGTTTASASPAPLAPDGTSATLRTVSLPPTDAGEPAGRMIAEVRRRSGLTWEELARVMRVSRRTLHLWANGRPIGAANEARLARLLSAVRAIDRGTARATRDAILAPTRGGVLPIDLLAEERFAEFRDAAGPGSDCPGRPSRAVSPRARTPVGPVALLGALQDGVETAPRPRVPGRSMRRPA